MNTMEKLDSAISEVLACDLDREDKIIIFSLTADICLEQALFHHLNSYTINVLLEKEENENG